MIAIPSGSLSRPKFSLPIFANRENKFVVGLIWTVIAASLYLTTNHVHIFEPRLLPMTWVDREVPFLPNTVWIYISEWAFFYVIFVFIKDSLNISRYLYSFMALQTVSCVIFWLWPTTFPRGEFPLPEDLNALTYFVFSGLRQTDSPANCAPSLHVSSVYLTSFIFFHEQRRKLVPFVLWATAIALSTLTTKQHYLVDIVSGLLMALISYWIFFYLVSYHEPARPFRGFHAKR
jgi:membrane-associated phospholipid phosphatase